MLRIFNAYRGISRVRLTRIEQRWNEDESSSVHLETVAFTMRVKPKPPQKTAAAAAAAAAILCQYIRGQKSNYRKNKRLREDKIRTVIPGWHTRRTHFSRLSSSKMSTSTPWLTWQWRSESNVLGGKTSSIENVGVNKIQKLTGERIPVWGLVALPLPQKLQICKLGDIRTIGRP